MCLLDRRVAGLWPGLACQLAFGAPVPGLGCHARWVGRYQGIAGDEHAAFGQVEGAMSAGVARGRDRHEAPRHVERG